MDNSFSMTESLANGARKYEAQQRADDFKFRLLQLINPNVLSGKTKKIARFNENCCICLEILKSYIITANIYHNKHMRILALSPITLNHVSKSLDTDFGIHVVNCWAKPRYGLNVYFYTPSVRISQHVITRILQRKKTLSFDSIMETLSGCIAYFDHLFHMDPSTAPFKEVMIGVPGGAVFVQVTDDEFIFTTFVDEMKLSDLQKQQLGQPIKFEIKSYVNNQPTRHFIDVWEPFVKTSK